MLNEDVRVGDITCVVIRNFCSRDDVLLWADKVILEAVSARRNIRVRPSSAAPEIAKFDELGARKKILES